MIGPVTERIANQDWADIERELDARGAAILPRLFDRQTCETLASWYDQPQQFRSKVVMSRHGFGRGEYQYFAYPLPPLIQTLRETLYPRLVPTANRWNQILGIYRRFPAQHADFISECRLAGQLRPTPLLLRYGPEDYNCLHQDLYGEQVFPLQVAVLLSEPGRDFTGGELVITEQRPRMQSRPEVPPLTQGDALVFTVSQRPMTGARGPYRVNLRHGVSRVRSGARHTLGVIFHDAA